MNDDLPNCPHCGTRMEPVADYPDWLIHRAAYQGSPLHQALRAQSYLQNPEAADAAHQARMAPYRRRIARMQWSDANARRLRGLLGPRI
jgi:hypothetical protein